MLRESVVVVYLLAVVLLGTVLATEESVYFKFYKNANLSFVAKGNSVERLEETGCNASDQFAFLIHGWRETCEIDWMTQLIEKLNTHRGGCIVCIDYGQVGFGSYPSMLKQFNNLTAIISNKLKSLNAQGMDPNNVYMFGFSFGGQLAVAAGKAYGTNQIKEIDTCDMAGPGFESRPNSIDHRGAAQNVQCIHTSSDKGTKVYACNQNWRMGYCGQQQPAKPKGSHQLCPYFYVNAFESPFYAVIKTRRCRSRNPASTWPDNFQMGYMEKRKSEVYGELFAMTGRNPPYNVLPTP